MDTTASPDRVLIRGAIEAMAPEFATLVGEIGDGGWKTKSGLPAYTCGELAWHLASGTAFLAGQIEKAKDGKALNPPAFVRPILYKLSEWRVRVVSRKATPASVLADFDSAARKLLAVLESFDDDTLRLSATRMGETMTIADMFQKPVEHLAEHAAQIRAGLAGA
ncbi:MAG: DinB family protein [Chloroflexi bacterium]|nr:DinB family protein [Chloroflexota bacterium]